MEDPLKNSDLIQIYNQRVKKNQLILQEKEMPRICADTWVVQCINKLFIKGRWFYSSC